MFTQGHQVGLNFANETEAEEFLLTVKAVQGWNNNKKMIGAYINLFFFIKNTSVQILIILSFHLILQKR